jgi:hypothetical protein
LDLAIPYNAKKFPKARVISQKKAPLKYREAFAEKIYWPENS